MAILETVQNGSSSPRRMKLKSPATEAPIGEITVTTSDEVRAAVRRARGAQPGWEATGFDGRRRYMDKALKILLKRQEEFIDVIVRETGRSRLETIMMEILPSCDSLAYYGKKAKKILADQKVPLHLLRNKKMILTYRPLGTIGIITPWNGPFIL